ncbi:MAG: MFS transporter [Candidatus Dormibacteraceae bacterium]
MLRGGAPIFRSLRSRNYRLYASGQIVSNVGSWVQRIAQDWLVLQLTHNNGAALGITTGLQFLPMLLFGLWGSSFGDRFPKQRVLVVTQTMMAVLAVALGVLTVSGVVQVWEVFAIAFALGAVTVVDNPTRQTFVMEMVGRDRLANAVSLNSATFNVARIAGPAVAGVLIAVIGTGPLFFVNAVSYVGPIVALLAMRVSELLPAPRVVRERGQIVKGLRYVRNRPELILPMVLIAFVSTFGMNLQITTALFATNVFQQGAGTYGLLTTAVAVGSVGGALLSATRARPSRKLLIVASLVFGTVELVAAMMPTYQTFMILLIPTGLASLVLVTVANSTIQLNSTDQMRGRVMALYLLLSMGGAPIGAPFVGWIADTLGARWSLLSGGVISVVATFAAVVLFFLLRDHRLPSPFALYRRGVARS